MIGMMALLNTQMKNYLLIERGVRHEKRSSHLGKIKSDIRRSVCILWNRNKQTKRNYKRQELQICYMVRQQAFDKAKVIR